MNVTDLTRRELFGRLALGAALTTSFGREVPASQNVPPPSGPYSLPPAHLFQDAPAAASITSARRSTSVVDVNGPALAMKRKRGASSGIPKKPAYVSVRPTRTRPLLSTLRTSSGATPGSSHATKPAQ